MAWGSSLTTEEFNQEVKKARMLFKLQPKLSGKSPAENYARHRAVQAVDWRNCRDDKQAEFLIEKQFPWELVSRIGLRTQQVRDQVNEMLQAASYKPQVEIKTEWYY